jgi:hypothetical protein
MTAMARAGAGQIGNYESCSFRTEGTGTFKGSGETKPVTGNPGKLENVKETKLEMIVPSWKLDGVIEAMLSVHPYEEVAYDVYDLANEARDTGAGIIGELERTMTLRTFLKHITKALGLRSVRYTGNDNDRVRRIAVCGGQGDDLLRTAIQRRADVYVTADIGYHTFQQAEGIIALIDAGHFETEVPVVPAIVDHLTRQCIAAKTKVKVCASEQLRNPVRYYLS